MSSQTTNEFQDLLMQVLKKTHQLRMAGMCPTCKQQIKINSFRDDISRKEFRLSGLCQECQDKFFEDNEEE